MYSNYWVSYVIQIFQERKAHFLRKLAFKIPGFYTGFNTKPLTSVENEYFGYNTSHVNRMIKEKNQISGNVNTGRNWS